MRTERVKFHGDTYTFTLSANQSVVQTHDFIGIETRDSALGTSSLELLFDLRPSYAWTD